MNSAIQHLVDQRGMPVHLQQALDAVRITGGEAVHPGTMDDIDEPATVEALMRMLNRVVEDLIAGPAEIASLYDSLPQPKLDGIDQRQARAEQAKRTEAVDTALIVAIVEGVALAVLGWLYWRAQRRAAIATEELARIERERRDDERRDQAAQPEARPRLCRDSSHGHLSVHNEGPATATHLSIEIQEGSAVRFGGNPDMPSRKLLDLDPGPPTSALMDAAAADDRVHLRLFWTDLRGPQNRLINSLGGDLPDIPRAKVPEALVRRGRGRRRKWPIG